MAELSDDIYLEITKLSEDINDLIDKNNFSEAIKLCWSAYDLLPEPKLQWDAALWLLVTIGDCNFLLKDYQAAFDNLTSAMHIEGAIGKPFLHLRIGQSAFELKLMDRAADELTRAYALAGKDIFTDQDKKYFEYLKTKIKKPFFKPW